MRVLCLVFLALLVASGLPTASASATFDSTIRSKMIETPPPWLDPHHPVLLDIQMEVVCSIHPAAPRADVERSMTEEVTFHALVDHSGFTVEVLDHKVRIEHDAERCHAGTAYQVATQVRVSAAGHLMAGTIAIMTVTARSDWGTEHSVEVPLRMGLTGMLELEVPLQQDVEAWGTVAFHATNHHNGEVRVTPEVSRMEGTMWLGPAPAPYVLQPGERQAFEFPVEMIGAVGSTALVGITLHMDSPYGPLPRGAEIGDRMTLILTRDVAPPPAQEASGIPMVALIGALVAALVAAGRRD